MFQRPEVNTAIKKTTPGRVAQWVEVLWTKPEDLRPTLWIREYWLPEVVLRPSHAHCAMRPWSPCHKPMKPETIPNRQPQQATSSQEVPKSVPQPTRTSSYACTLQVSLCSAPAPILLSQGLCTAAPLPGCSFLCPHSSSALPWSLLKCHLLGKGRAAF